MRRVLLIALVGLILISLVDWIIDYQIGQYQQSRNTQDYYESLFGGAVFLGFRDSMTIIWSWISGNHDALLVIFTGSLFLVTAFLVRYTKRLWKSTSDLVIDSKDTAKKELRAYLGISDAKISRLGPDRIQANVTVNNTGKTPAKNVTKAIKAEIRDTDSHDPFPEPETVEGSMPIAPGSYWVFRDEIHNISDGDMKALFAYKKRVFVWGWSNYIDINGDRQSIKFRFRNLAAHQQINYQEKDGKVVVASINVSGWDLHPEEEGNDCT